MKYIDKVLKKNLSYEAAVNESNLVAGGLDVVIGKHNGEEIHFMNSDDYYILFPNGTIISNPMDIIEIETDCWSTVQISQIAKRDISKFFIKS